MIFKKIVNRIIKNISQQIFFSYLAEQNYQKKIKQYAERISSVSAADYNIVKSIVDSGAVVTSLDKLQIPNTEKLIECCDRVLPKLISATPNNKRQFFICNSSDRALEHADIYIWGLETRLLNIVENYLRLPVAYHGMYLRKDLANNVVRKSRLWHIDKEDRRMLKIIIYLNDVGLDNGCFQYVHKCHTDRIYRQLRYNHEYIKSSRFDKVVSKSEKISCCGKAGTVIFVDTSSVFHRGKLPETSDRLTIFFDYTSSYPLRPYYCKPSFSIRDLLILSKKFTYKQKKCVFWSQQLQKTLARFEE